MTGLILRELLHRRLSALLAVLAVGAAVAVLVGARLSLRAFDLATEAAATAKEAAVLQSMKELQDRMRRIMLGMGFNVVALPRAQPLDRFLAGHPPEAWMPEEWADRLAARQPKTINHIAPALQGRLPWPELGRDCELIGVKGEIFLQSPTTQKPIQDRIAPGTVVLGQRLARDLGLAVGDTVRLGGGDWSVGGIKAGRGNRDDLVVWMALADVQRLLGRPGEISAIYALECECGADLVEAVRREVGAILPEVHLQEFSNLAVARDQARRHARVLAAEAAEQERMARERLRADKSGLAGSLVQMLIAAAILVVGALAALNARDRAAEIGLLRAVGLRTRQVLVLFLGRAMVIGLLGAGVGIAAGIVSAGWGRPLAEWLPPDPRLLAGVAAGSALTAVLAALLPALVAALRDPASTLRED